VSEEIWKLGWLYLCILQLLKFQQAPQLERVIKTNRSQLLAIERERNRTNFIAMSFQRNYLLRRLNVPQLHCFVITLRGQIIAIWWKCKRVNPFCMPLKLSYLLLWLDAPQFDQVIITTRSQIPAVRREYHRLGGVITAMWLQCSNNFLLF
jgi:hypothetical protein